MKGLLVNYEYCTGCHSCEIACKKHLKLGEGEWGIKLGEIGPIEFAGKHEPDKVDWVFAPILTKACDMCQDRVDMGKMPMCVQHCQAWCMYYGETDDLVKKIDAHGRWMLLSKTI